MKTQKELLQICLKQQVKMNKLSKKAMFCAQYTRQNKKSSKFFASTDSIVKHKRQDAELRKERINHAVKCFYDSKKELLKTKKATLKYICIARSLDFIFNELLDNKHQDLFYAFIDFKIYVVKSAQNNMFDNLSRKQLERLTESLLTDKSRLKLKNIKLNIKNEQLEKQIEIDLNISILKSKIASNSN